MINDNFIFDGEPDADAYAKKQKRTLDLYETDKRLATKLKYQKQEAVQNQFIAFKKVYVKKDEEKEKLKQLVTNEV